MKHITCLGDARVFVTIKDGTRFIYMHASHITFYVQIIIFNSQQLYPRRCTQFRHILAHRIDLFKLYIAIHASDPLIGSYIQYITAYACIHAI